MSEQNIQARQISGAGYLNLRGDPDDASFLDAVKAVTKLSLPVEPNTFVISDTKIFWLGPNEWLIAAPAARASTLLSQLPGALAKFHAAVNDVSGGYIDIQLAGERVRSLLAKGCTLDFHPDSFKVGTCAQSGLGKTAAMIALIDDEPTFEIIVRRSFADYVLKWLEHAGREYGIEFP